MGTLLAFAGRAKVPRQECNLMDERLKVVARVLDGEKIAALCREFGISRKTGHKIISRYVMLRTGRTDGPLATSLPARQGCPYAKTAVEHL